MKLPTKLETWEFRQKWGLSIEQFAKLLRCSRGMAIRIQNRRDAQEPTRNDEQLLFVVWILLRVPDVVPRILVDMGIEPRWKKKDPINLTQFDSDIGDGNGNHNRQ